MMSISEQADHPFGPTCHEFDQAVQAISVQAVHPIRSKLSTEFVQAVRFLRVDRIGARRWFNRRRVLGKPQETLWPIRVSNAHDSRDTPVEVRRPVTEPADRPQLRDFARQCRKYLERAERFGFCRAPGPDEVLPPN